jgi:ABC-type lipoprotein release transport system permease subunit
VRNLFRMAWRNVWRNPRRSGVTIAAMALALVMEVLYGGLVDGMIVDMEEDAVGFELGDAQVMAPDYLDRPSLYAVLPDSAALIAALEGEGLSVAPRLQAGGLAAAGEQSAGVMIVGLDPARDAGVLQLHEAVAAGAWLDPAAPGEVVVGRGLARALGLSVGSELVVLSQAADGSVANALFTVRGVLASVGAGVDRSGVLLTEPAFRDLMVLPDGVHKLVLRAAPGTTPEQAAASAQALAPGAKVMTWAELNPILAQMLGSVRVTLVVVYLVIYVAVAILILNAMLMAVFERVREFGVLKAIGYGPGQVLLMMLMEGLLQAVVATAIGLAVAAAPAWYLQTHGIDVGALGGVSMVGVTMPPVWRGVFSPVSVQLPVVLLFFIALVAVALPAAKAAWIRPVEAMRHQ